MTLPSSEPAPVAVRPSPVHGLGLFATRRVAAGEPLCDYRGERITKEESRRRTAAAPPGAPLFIVALDDTTDLDGDIPDNPAKHANHGCRANARLVAQDGALRLIADRDIAPDEEILFDYGFSLADSVAHPCRCGAPECVGRIVAEPLRPRLRRLRGGGKKRAADTPPTPGA